MMEEQERRTTVKFRSRMMTLGGKGNYQDVFNIPNKFIAPGEKKISKRFIVGFLLVRRLVIKQWIQ